ncbi:hypothetical protein BVRB_019590, partial [Beta vulgaris subsp. vulgaris]
PHVHSPSSQDIIVAKRILRYLQNTRNFGIRFKSEQDPVLEAYVDADWANDAKDRKSTSGYVVFLNGPICWSSRKQKVVALSSTEVEYVALTEVCKELSACRRVISEAGVLTLPGPTIIHEDNQSAIALSESETTTRRSKHIDVKYHYIREEVKKGAVTVQYIPSAENCADIFTKALAQPAFCRHARNLITAAKIKEGVDATDDDPAACTRTIEPEACVNKLNQ